LGLEGDREAGVVKPTLDSWRPDSTDEVGRIGSEKAPLRNWRFSKMRKTMNIAVLALLTVVLTAGTSYAQAVTLAGKLQIGFGDQNNITGFRSNNAVPICAGQGSLVNPGTIGTTLGTLLVAAQGTAAPGVGGAITFNAVGNGNGGAQQRDNATCNVAIPPFANPRLRSRTQVGAAHWPSRKGDFTTNIINASVPATPTATYMLSASGGYNQAATAFSWTLTDEAGPPGTMGTPAPTTMINETGSAISASVPFYGTGIGGQRVQPAGRFGGGVPFSGGGGVQLGVNTVTKSAGGDTLVPTFIPGPNFGEVNYANGFLPTSPQIFGTDATGVNILGQITAGIFTPNFTYTLGLINGRQDLTYAFRTPGGSTINQHGNVQTAFGGNTVTPMSGMVGPMTTVPAGPPIITPVAFSGQFGQWTTGGVTHTDQVGDFRTVRQTSGSDTALAPGTNNGATRRLQVVAPWSATIRTVGVFGVPLPVLGFGGISKLTVDVIPAPEPGTIAMLGFGVMGLVGLGATRRRNG
jgi:hypothetical protein